jgi:photosystem II stability/assembly factor-like uncharacterized protein
VFKSADGGRTWAAANSGLRSKRVAALVIDPHDPEMLYAGTDDAVGVGPGVFRSANGGKTWRPFSQGLKTLSVSTLAIDATGSRLYAGTLSGVFDYRFGG